MLKLITTVQAYAHVLKDKRGVTALEYGLVASVVVGATMVGFKILANALSTSFSTTGNSL